VDSPLARRSLGQHLAADDVGRRRLFIVDHDPAVAPGLPKKKKKKSAVRWRAPPPSLHTPPAAGPSPTMVMVLRRIGLPSGRHLALQTEQARGDRTCAKPFGHSEFSLSIALKKIYHRANASVLTGSPSTAGLARLRAGLGRIRICRRPGLKAISAFLLRAMPKTRGGPRVFRVKNRSTPGYGSFPFVAAFEVHRALQGLPRGDIFVRVSKRG